MNPLFGTENWNFLEHKDTSNFQPRFHPQNFAVDCCANASTRILEDNKGIPIRFKLKLFDKTYKLKKEDPFPGRQHHMDMNEQHKHVYNNLPFLLSYLFRHQKRILLVCSA